jgi:hypothetical protein
MLAQGALAVQLSGKRTALGLHWMQDVHININQARNASLGRFRSYEAEELRIGGLVSHK